MAQRATKLGIKIFRTAEKSLLLQVLDQQWKEHLQALEQLRQSIGLRAYGQKDPLNEYKNEAFGLFEELIFNLKNDVAKIFSRMAIRPNVQLNPDDDGQEVKKSELAPVSRNNKKIPRNSPCPCGSGKKYKHCHGKIN